VRRDLCVNQVHTRNLCKPFLLIKSPKYKWSEQYTLRRRSRTCETVIQCRDVKRANLTYKRRCCRRHQYQWRHREMRWRHANVTVTRRHHRHQNVMTSYNSRTDKRSRSRKCPSTSSTSRCHCRTVARQTMRDEPDTIQNHSKNEHGGADQAKLMSHSHHALLCCCGHCRRRGNRDGRGLDIDACSVDWIDLNSNWIGFLSLLVGYGWFVMLRSLWLIVIEKYKSDFHERERFSIQ